MLERALAGDLSGYSEAGIHTMTQRVEHLRAVLAADRKGLAA
jgi:hypothetical protein